MRYFGIKTPETASSKPYVWWITDSEHKSWMSFFKIANKDGEHNAFTLPLADAIRAYECIGYSCVELDVKEQSK